LIIAVNFSARKEPMAVEEQKIRQLVEEVVQRVLAAIGKAK